MEEQNRAKVNPSFLMFTTHTMHSLAIMGNMENIGAFYCKTVTRFQIGLRSCFKKT